MDWDGTLLARVMKPAEERFIRQFDSCIRSDKKDALQPLIDELLHLLNADIFDSHLLSPEEVFRLHLFTNLCDWEQTYFDGGKEYGDLGIRKLRLRPEFDEGYLFGEL